MKKCDKSTEKINCSYDLLQASVTTIHRQIGRRHCGMGFDIKIWKHFRNSKSNVASFTWHILYIIQRKCHKTKCYKQAHVRRHDSTLPI